MVLRYLRQGWQDMGWQYLLKEYELIEKHQIFLGMYTVEIVAVLVALGWVEKTRLEKVLICSDSSSIAC